MKVTGSRRRTKPGRTEWIAVMRRRKTSGARRVVEAEDSAGGVDPDLLNGLVIGVALERAQPRHGVEYVGTRPLGVDERRDESGVGAAQVVLLGLGDELFQVGGVLERVDAASAHQLANLGQEKIGSVHDASQRGSRMRVRS